MLSPGLDLFAQDIAVAGVPGELRGHEHMDPAKADDDSRVWMLPRTCGPKWEKTSVARPLCGRAAEAMDTMLVRLDDRREVTARGAH